MRRTMLMCVAVLAASLLWGCVARPIEPAPTLPETTAAPTTTPTTVPVTTEPTEPTTQSTTLPPSQPATQPTEPRKENLQQVKWIGFNIFSDPTYDAFVVQPLPAGTYTVVKEEMDEEGHIWGKLKSGLGWINLTEIRRFDEPIAVGDAPKELLDKGNYAEYVDATGEYAVPVAIQACEKLASVSVHRCELGDIGMVATEQITVEPGMDKGDVLVVWVEFPGDMSTFQINFCDSQGNFYRYQMAMSGRNGAVDAWSID